MAKVLVAPSILSADFTKLGKEVAEVESAGADWIHVDVMDGSFVPNITMGPLVVKAIRPVTRLAVDVHLMIAAPEAFVTPFCDAGADLITFHREACEDPEGLIALIRARGKKVGVSIKPKTPVSLLDGLLDRVDLVLVMTVEPGFGGQSFMADCVPKISEIRKRFGKDIQVDGGINAGNAGMVLAAGANVLVAGTSVFGSSDYRKAISALKAAG